jgi:citrate lyase beta subunit
MTDRDLALCRSWLFVGGPDATAATAADSGADVVILELEDFTPPELRIAARAAAPALLGAWAVAGAVPAVRINRLADGGRDDLAAVMRGDPEVVMLPKVAGPGDIAALAAAVAAEEARLGLAPGRTRLVPNIETAAALFRTREIAASDPRVIGCLMASEDLTADLGAPRSRAGTEIAFARAWFHAACVAADVLSIDYPYTYADAEGLKQSCADARALGYTAKSLVAPGHAALVNAAMAPSAAEVAEARQVVSTFEAARAAGHATNRARAELDGHLVEVPSYRNAQALLDRAERLARHFPHG